LPFSATPPPVAATPKQEAIAYDHVRPVGETIATLIQHAGEKSHTFQGLLDTINARDGLVYILPGKCGHGMHGCLANVTTAAPTRLLLVRVDPRGNDCELMGLIGHELQHAIEVLDDPQVTSFVEAYSFYRRAADAGSIPAFETRAAERIEEKVRTEVREKSRCTTIR